MKINKVSVIVDIEGAPCVVLLSEMDEQKRNLFAQTISAFCKEPRVLQVVKLNKSYSFLELGKDDLLEEST